jgi:bifunctional UDP-N-acetylglucosamine pyrophosphorylase/glucosamine-1-phosphate N-acetyltransferase
MKDLVAVILAAGQGTRMYSGLPKVLHTVAGHPMLDHVLSAIEALEPAKIVVVTGFMGEMVERHVGRRAVCVRQDKRLGTAHAVRMALPEIKDFQGTALVTVGDAPLIQTQTLRELIKRRKAHHVAATVLTAEMEEPTGYGRIVRNRDATVRKIVEEKDTNSYEAVIKEINTGIYAFDCQKLIAALAKVRANNAQKEYYLTDTVEILNGMDEEVEPVLFGDPTETMGINSRAELARAEGLLRRRIARAVMDSGVTVIDPATTYIDKQVKIGRDSVIRPFTILQGKCEIGPGCDVGPHATIVESTLGEGCHVRLCHIEHASLGQRVSVGPFASVRPGSRVRDEARIGSFVEVTRSDVGPGSDILHLSYIGDAVIGPRSSVGAGSVTVNFDGRQKHETHIGSDVFLGTNTSLVAPVDIADGSRFAHNEVLTGKLGEGPITPAGPKAGAANGMPPGGRRRSVGNAQGRSLRPTAKAGDESGRKRRSPGTVSSNGN